MRALRASWLLLTSGLLVGLFLAPDEVNRLTPKAFLRVPLDLIIGVLLVLVLPKQCRRVAVPVVGVALGALAVLKLLSLAFSTILDRPFDPAADWSFLGAGRTYLQLSSGRLMASAAVGGAILLALAILALAVVGFRGIAHTAARHRDPAVRTLAVLGIAWMVLFLTGAQIVHTVPVAARDGYNRVHQAIVGAQAHREFAAAVDSDPFRDATSPGLLADLRGKDVVFAVVESYGRTALQRPEIASKVDPVLTRGFERLKDKGYTARSGYLTSTTVGGGSWLADSTLLSGLRIDNQQRYHTLTNSRRMTLTSAFAKTGARTVAVMPATVADYPEAKFFGYDRVYARKDLQYKGPPYAFGMMPDQYTLAMFERMERPEGNRTPVMAVIPLISSHAPWAPVPTLRDWSEAADSGTYEAKAGSGDSPDLVTRRNPAMLRADYGNAIQYSLETLISYIETYGDENLVMVFLGDHQPAPAVTGPDATRDVPITIVASDKTVMDKVEPWHWTQGLRPASNAPVWPMEEFRDRFLSTFSR